MRENILPNNNSEIYRKSEESLEQYEFRLFYDKYLLNLTNQDIADLLNYETGQDFDESAYRKRTMPKVIIYDDIYDKAYLDVLRSLDQDENPEFLQEKNERYDKFLKAKYQVQDQNRIYNNKLRAEARADHILDVFRTTAQIVSKNDPIIFNEPISKRDEDKAGVLLLSDWHYGLNTVNIFGEFNKDILKDAIEELTFEVIEIAKKENINKLIVLNLGDLINGNIHLSTRIESDEDAVRQTIGVIQLIKSMLSDFSKKIPKIEFHSVTDNHARINKSFNEHIEKENFNLIISTFLEEWSRDKDNVKIVSNKINGVESHDIGHFKLFGSDMLFTHGHRGRINTVVQDLSLMLKMFPETIFTAHLHHSASGEEHKIDHIQNPALAMTDDYAISIRKSARQRQKLVIYENDKDTANMKTVHYLEPKSLKQK